MKKNIKIICNITVFSMVAFCQIAVASKLPTKEEISGVLLACSESRSQSVQGDLKGALEAWRKGAEIKGRAELNDLGEIIRSFKDENLRLEAYRIYMSCLKGALTKVLDEQESANNFVISGATDDEKKLLGQH